MSEDSLQQRISELESQLAFQEDAIESLDISLAEQQKSLLLLERKLALMEARMREAVQGVSDIKGSEKPPHY